MVGLLPKDKMNGFIGNPDRESLSHKNGKKAVYSGDKTRKERERYIRSLSVVE